MYAASGTLVAVTPVLGPGETTGFNLSGTTATISSLTPKPAAGLTCDDTAKTCKAPAAPAPGLAVTGDVTVTAMLSDGTSLSTTVTLVDDPDASQRGPWEARVIVGYHQAGAASSDFAQNVINDIYTVRTLSKNDPVWKAKFNTWGNVRIASSPQQIEAPFITAIQGLVAPGTNPNAPSPLNTPVNQLALSAEFETGLEWNMTPNWGGKVLGLIGFFGATGAFQAPDKTVHLFVAPTPGSPQYSLFQQRFPGANTTYIGIVNPDRDRFSRQWGAGFRYSRFHPGAVESPQTFSFTLGQDELITGGSFQSVVARFDGFYPLPVGGSSGRWHFLYVFGTVSLRLSAGDDKTPLVLQEAPTTVNAFDNTVTIVAKGSNRDTYRIGIGADLVNLLRSAFK
jgi:hypothetical protein